MEEKDKNIVKDNNIVGENNIMNVENMVSVDKFNTIIEEFKKENKVLKDEIMKLKETQVIATPVIEEKHEIERKLWEEIF